MQKNFDQKPLQKYYHYFFSEFDWFRIESILYKYLTFYSIYKYKPLFYKYENFSIHDILEFLKRPFTCEKFSHPNQIKNTPNARSRLYSVVNKYLNDKDLIDINGKKIELAPLLTPENNC